ncbi:MAG: hypothetical protein QOC96_3734 [Acidobacteriota bacterium]|jgi:hypothetical protein|nr:hypothetical protein [Acidobacteriota bacterium]
MANFNLKKDATRHLVIGKNSGERKIYRINVNTGGVSIFYEGAANPAGSVTAPDSIDIIYDNEGISLKGEADNNSGTYEIVS